MVNLQSSPSFDKSTGLQLAKARKNAKLTQKVLANKIGITRQQLSKYENGYGNPSFQRMCDICKILQLNPNYFIER